MLKNLNKEYTIKRTLKIDIISGLITGICWTVILYICLTEFNEEIVEFMKSVDENNLALQSTLILFPIIIIGSIFINIGNKVGATSNNKSSNNKRK